MSGMIKRLNHISVAVDSIDDALKFYRDLLGLEIVETVTLGDRELKVAFVKVGDTEIELLEPTSQANTVTRLLARRRPGPHHICPEVVDAAAAMDELSASGPQDMEPEPAPMPDGPEEEIPAKQAPAA